MNGPAIEGLHFAGNLVSFQTALETFRDTLKP
jgi:hypothetical protein